MYSDDQGDDCLHDFPIEKPCFNAAETPYVTSLPDILYAFRKNVGYDVQFYRDRPNAADAELKLALNDSADDRRAEFAIGGDNESSFGKLVMERADDATQKLDWDAASELVGSLANLLAENYQWRRKVERCEEELAASDLAYADLAPSERGTTSRKLRETLRTGAAALGDFDAAALYLLDPTTMYLVLRSVWGLPQERYLDEPRKLQGSRAELEALLGSAVVINDEYLAEAWNAPEDFPCAVCVPVVADSDVLGVVWYYSNTPHKIGKREMETLSLISSKLVDELEKGAPRGRGVDRI